jgi:hypothetical protein
MKFKKIILGTFLISTAIIVPIVTIAVMSSKHSSNFRTMTIYGAENLSEIADSPGSANFQAINYVGDDVTNDST